MTNISTQNVKINKKLLKIASKIKILCTQFCHNNATTVFRPHKLEITNCGRQVAAHCNGVYLKNVRENWESTAVVCVVQKRSDSSGI